MKMLMRLVMLLMLTALGCAVVSQQQPFMDKTIKEHSATTSMIVFYAEMMDDKTEATGNFSKLYSPKLENTTQVSCYIIKTLQ